LITAVEVRNFAKTGEKTLYVERGSIITPAAWDEAKEMAISIQTAPEKSPEDAEMHERNAHEVNPDFLARVVGEVIACLQQSKQTMPLQAETDPCGLKLIWGEHLVYCGSVTGSPRDNIQVAEIVGAKDSKQLSARLMKMEDTSFSRKTVFDETVYIVEGKLECTVNGKRYRGSMGDSFYIPANQQITLSTPGRAVCFIGTSALC
jgi:ethanolamine utilization protein EutQ